MSSDCANCDCADKSHCTPAADVSMENDCQCGPNCQCGSCSCHT